MFSNREMQAMGNMSPENKSVYLSRIVVYGDATNGIPSTKLVDIEKPEFQDLVNIQFQDPFTPFVKQIQGDA